MIRLRLGASGAENCASSALSSIVVRPHNFTVRRHISQTPR